VKVVDTGHQVIKLGGKKALFLRAKVEESDESIQSISLLLMDKINGRF
jgi:hypothetical protein